MNKTNILDFSNLRRIEFNTRILSIIFATLGSLLFVSLWYPISLVLDGQWKLNQQIDLFFIEKLKIADFELPIGNVSVRFYSICILLGLLSGYILCLYLAKRSFIASTTIDRLFVGLVIVGLIGARLFYAAFNWEKYSENPTEIFTEITRGGLAIFGTIIFSAIYIWVYARRFKFNFFEFADVLVPGLLIGQVIGRFGNFFNYEAYGGPTTAFWKWYIPQTANVYQDPTQQYFHPTFLYEIIPNFILLVVILFFYEKLTARRSGLVFGIYAVGYGLIRFFTEFFRLDALKIALGQTLRTGSFSIDSILVSQFSAVILLVCGVLTIVLRRKVIYSRKTMIEIRV